MAPGLAAEPLEGHQLVAAKPRGGAGRLGLVGHRRPTALLDERAAVVALQQLQRRELRLGVATGLEPIDADRRHQRVARARRGRLGHPFGAAPGDPAAPGEADHDRRDDARRAQPQEVCLGGLVARPTLPESLQLHHDRLLPSTSRARAGTPPGCTYRAASLENYSLKWDGILPIQSAFLRTEK